MSDDDKKYDPEKVIGDTSSEDRGGKTGIDYERAQQLADLPDPDEGKTDEERKAIVRRTSTNTNRPRDDDEMSMNPR